MTTLEHVLEADSRRKALALIASAGLAGAAFGAFTAPGYAAESSVSCHSFTRSGYPNELGTLGAKIGDGYQATASLASACYGNVVYEPASELAVKNQVWRNGVVCDTGPIYYNGSNDADAGGTLNWSTCGAGQYYNRASGWRLISGSYSNVEWEYTPLKYYNH